MTPPPAGPRGPGLHYCHPAVPNAFLLPSHLRPGAQISIQGKVPARTRRFSFNLQKGTGKKVADVSFHFNARFDEGPVVVRNARLEGSWGEEERGVPAEFPFAHKENFRVVLQAHEECYKVVVNDKTVVDFALRRPLDFPTHFSIKGEVKIFSVSFAQPLISRLVASLPSCSQAGDLLLVNGRTPAAKANFKVNVQSDASDESQVLLHFNPRLEIGQVVRNSRLEGKWGAEETSGGMPFRAGDNFSLILATLQDRFQMFVDGKHLADFAHRAPFETGNAVLIDGDVSLYNVIVESPCHKVYPPVGLKKIKPDHVVAQEFNPLIPATLPLPGGLSVDRIILITGVPSSNCSKFEVNLMVGSNPSSSNLALHFNPRFKDGPLLVRNARLGSTWGSEELDGPAEFPFQRGVHFDLAIACQPSHLEVFVDGASVCTFVHRAPLGEVDHVSIAGDVFVKRVLFA